MADPKPSPDPDCELCQAQRITEWFYEDDTCWIAECEACDVPMVVWKQHDPNPTEEVRVVLEALLSAVVVEHYGFEFWVDAKMRSIPTHWHAHARPRGASMGQADHEASAEASQPFTEPVVDSGATVDAVVDVT